MVTHTYRKAISTRYVGPTNARGSRIIASDGDGNRFTLPYPHELSMQDGHAKAAQMLMDKMGWTDNLISGSTGTGYVFVMAEVA